MVKKQKAKRPAFILVSLVLLVIGVALLYGSITLLSISSGSLAIVFSSVPLLRMLEFDLGAVFVFSGSLVLSVA
ncbi:MAG: hypothetical protein ABSF44_02430 [Candidatus Bathyarchaeia archaeon]